MLYFVFFFSFIILFTVSGYSTFDNDYLYLLQMIHFITMALGGDGYLNFMGNEVNALPQILLDKLRSQFTYLRFLLV